MSKDTTPAELKVYIVTSNVDELVTAAYAFNNRKEANDRMATLKALQPEAEVLLQVDTVSGQEVIDTINDTLRLRGYQNV